MKCVAVFAAILSVAFAGQQSGPVFHVNINDPSLKDGAGSLNLEGEYSRELVDNVNAGVKYDYNANRGLPSSLWVSTSADIDDDTKLCAKAEYDVKSKATVIEARLERGSDGISIDFDTGSNEAGPLKLRKVLDMNGRRLTLEPTINVRDRTGELVINTEVDEDKTTAELTLNQADESASLEVSHRLDDFNVVSPKVNLKSGDVSVRLNRALDNGGVIEVTADRKNVDWEFNENAWTVKGNIPLEDTGASTISFKRSINLS
ncbi:hypothetical protein JKP88DRAFT_196192 [Tribonema minus]|uniref:Uncharacterized protein n=1 Tax=Tribonema minus TaxID=303371 RepID=A0A836CCC7_9STRA|nr:hypothetical protein JKP88DRAFT_196192 [Tribonema minus]